MTGEIDLIGNITAIGGLEAKLVGAKKARVTIALIPEENSEQLDRLRIEKKSPEDETFKVIKISHINEALEFIFNQEEENH